MVEYINTGKKVKPTCDDWEDLTYNKVYDVFTDGTIEFVFDDVGVRCYQSSAIFEVVDDTVNTDNTAVETNNKFKEGDKVMVVNTDYISAYDVGVRVGDIGTVIGAFESGVDKYHVKFEGTGYDCDWFFTGNCIELVGDKHSNGNNYILDDDEQPKQQFSVGDKVKVTSIDYICQCDANIKVGDVGVITHIWCDNKTPYQVFDWYFPEDDLELVVGDSLNNPIKSDGGSSSYYTQQIPKGMLERFNTTNTIEAKDVIRLFLGNDFNMGNIFKAYCRVISLRNGKGKAGIDEKYDLTKAKFFAEDELNSYLENTNAQTRN